jgi:hypothetical protein
METTPAQELIKKVEKIEKKSKWRTAVITLISVVAAVILVVFTVLKIQKAATETKNVEKTIGIALESTKENAKKQVDSVNKVAADTLTKYTKKLSLVSEYNDTLYKALVRSDSFLQVMNLHIKEINYAVTDAKQRKLYKIDKIDEDIKNFDMIIMKNKKVKAVNPTVFKNRVYHPTLPPS